MVVSANQTKKEMRQQAFTQVRSKGAGQTMPQSENPYQLAAKANWNSKKSLIPDPQNYNSKRSLMPDVQELRTPYFKEKSQNQFEGRNEISPDTDLNSDKDASQKLHDKSR